MTAITNHYFVDEAGDLTLFSKRGQQIIGREGVSRAFMVGVAHIPDPESCLQKLESLRQALLGDPYFKDVPSMQPERERTAVVFHAKNDLPEVRREVFKLLPSLGAKVQIALRRKETIAREAEIVYQRSGMKLYGNEIYDDLVKRLFKNLQHKAEENRITFARRGKSARQHALQEAIKKAQSNFQNKWGARADRQTIIDSTYPSKCAGLQVIDYYLWALQRLVERREDRFFQLLASQYRLVMDLDDKRHKPYGEWYSDSNPLTLNKIRPVTG